MYNFINQNGTAEMSKQKSEARIAIENQLSTMLDNQYFEVSTEQINEASLRKFVYEYAKKHDLKFTVKKSLHPICKVFKLTKKDTEATVNIAKPKLTNLEIIFIQAGFRRKESNDKILRDLRRADITLEDIQELRNLPDLVKPPE